MKQIIHSLKTGNASMVDIPVPKIRSGHLQIASSRTLISPGTERMLIDFGKANLLQKARQQPDKVKLVLNKLKTDGVHPTFDAVFSKLDQPIALGYCNVGKIIGIGDGVDGFTIGERVVSNGNHAEVVNVPTNLCAKIPGTVDDDAASFAVLGAIALQGIRHVEPSLGETVAVIGLGLVGLLTVQLLVANGCKVLGMDYNKDRLDIAQSYGATVVDLNQISDPKNIALACTNGRGVDAVIIASATKSNKPIHQAADISRQRGRIVLVGTCGLSLSRDYFYKKELSFSVSSSYGPGRYDKNYEDYGQDYPLGFVRWTAKRNIEAVIELIANNKLDVGKLISNRFQFNDASEAYETMLTGRGSIGILLEFQTDNIEDREHNVQRVADKNRIKREHLHSCSTLDVRPKVSFIGAGSYAVSKLIPNFKRQNLCLHTVVSQSGVSGFHAAKKFGFENIGSDTAAVFADTETDIVVVATRHDTHAEFVVEALEAGKHVFVEKPMCLNLSDFAEIKRAYGRAKEKFEKTPLLMVGFNRRFAPHTSKMRHLLHQKLGPKFINVIINAGSVDADHWTRDKKIGGGRIVGEACHFIDLMRFLIGNPIKSYNVVSMSPGGEKGIHVQFCFTDGSIGSLSYLANGHPNVPKERVEVFAEGSVLQLDNFRKLKGFGYSGFKGLNLWSQDKGQMACVGAFVDAVRTVQPSPIPAEELFEVSEISINLSGLVD